MSSPGAEPRVFQFLQKPAAGGLNEEQLRQLQLAKSDPTGQQAAILVVDDSDTMRDVIVLMLQQLGYENVTAATDGAVALRLLQKIEFDLVVLDIEMPRVNGYQVLTALKNDPVRRHLPVIVTSGLDQDPAVVRCLELGAEDFLPKPVDKAVFRARIASSLERKRLRDLDRLRLLQLRAEHDLLVAEQEKSERLLLNVLPRSIAIRLKQGERAIAERFTAVTVLFADLVDFTSLAQSLDPADLVALLNDLFSRFDRLAADHGVEKIKTIGDSYMVVGGLPERRADHAEAIAAMALAMLAAVADLNRGRGRTLCLRIGLHSGPVVAGVIGRQKFSYDLWGYTVNIASRMQSRPRCRAG